MFGDLENSFTYVFQPLLGNIFGTSYSADKNVLSENPQKMSFLSCLVFVAFVVCCVDKHLNNK